MDEHDFRRLLDQFPVVRSRNYRADSVNESGSQPKLNEVTEQGDALGELDKKGETREVYCEEQFWQKLRSAAEEKVDPATAGKFCKAFQTVYTQIVHEKLSLDAARKFIGS